MKLAPFDDDGDLLAVVETPKGSRSKYSWDEKREIYELKKVLPAGAEGEKKERNDRLIAVATASHSWKGVKQIDDLGETLLSEIERFFVSYNAFPGRTFEPIGRSGAARAESIVERSRANRPKTGRRKRKK
jgi:inorganic pyrophosphatase